MNQRGDKPGGGRTACQKKLDLGKRVRRCAVTSTAQSSDTSRATDECDSPGGPLDRSEGVGEAKQFYQES